MVQTAMFGRGRPTARRGSSLTFVLTILVVMAMVAVGVWWYLSYGDGERGEVPMLRPVDRGPFDHVVLEQGEIESSSNVEVICEVRSRGSSSGGVAILWAIDEGTHVKKGDRLIELDSSGLEEELKQQRIIVNSSLAMKISAIAALEMAEIAKEEYVQGTFRNEESEIESEIAVAEQELRRAQLNLQSTERLAAKGLVTELQIEAEAFAVQNAKNMLDAARSRLRVLRDLTKKKLLVEFDSEIETKRAAVESETSSHEEEVARLEDLQDQIAKCVIYAPQDGVVVHANQYSARGGSAEFVVEPGAIVRERQALIRLPDPTQMQVKATINESQISLVQPGMPAKIRIGAAAGEVLDGVVTRVNQYAEPTSWWGSSVKEFGTYIRIIDPPPTIRTGMTAEVQILVDHRDDALQVPVQALYEHRGRLFCLIRNGEHFETREVTIGASNDRSVTIDDGLNEGELVVLNPRRHIEKMQLPDLPRTEVAQFRRPPSDDVEFVAEEHPAEPGDGVRGANDAPQQRDWATDRETEWSPQPQRDAGDDSDDSPPQRDREDFVAAERLGSDSFQAAAGEHTHQVESAGGE